MPFDGSKALPAQLGGQRSPVGEQSLSHEQREGKRHQEWVPVEEHASVIGAGVDLRCTGLSRQGPARRAHDKDIE